MSVFTLFADRPIRDPEDQLWFSAPQDRAKPKPIRRQLDQIAETLVAPLAPGAKPAASLTIAIHGAPGSGKSSALNVLWDLAREKARALGSGADGDAIAARLVRCAYVAPNWESPDLTPRTSLVASMLVALAGGETEAVSKLLASTQSIAEAIRDASQPSDAQGRKMWASKMVGLIASEVSKLRNVEEILRDSLPDKSGAPRVLAMLIDDLDRCDPAFVYAILSELLEHGDLDNFFFILAASPGTLARAVTDGASVRAADATLPAGAHRPASPIAVRGQIGVSQELAKLVQHIVDVPLVDGDGMRALLGRLFEDKLASGKADPVAQAIVDSAPLFVLALPEATPRAVKRCLNFLVARLGEGAIPSDSVAGVRAHIKRLLLEYAWPDFLRDWFDPMTSDGPARSLAPIVMLEETVSRAALVDNSDRRVLHELEYVCDAFPSLPWRELPVALLRFLSASPRLATMPTQAAPPRRERIEDAKASTVPPPGKPEAGAIVPSAKTDPEDILGALGLPKGSPLRTLRLGNERMLASDAPAGAVAFSLDLAPVGAPDPNAGDSPDDPAVLEVTVPSRAPDPNAGDGPDDAPMVDDAPMPPPPPPGPPPPFAAPPSFSRGPAPPPGPPAFGPPPPFAPPPPVRAPGAPGASAAPAVSAPGAPPPSASAPGAPPPSASAEERPMDVPSLAPPDLVIDEALRDVQRIADPIARVDRAAHAIFGLRDLGDEAEPAAICLARALWPSVTAAPRDGVMLCAVMDVYVALLQERGQRRTACGVLQRAYEVLGDNAHVRERYSLFLTGAGALQAARKVLSHQPVDVAELFADDAVAVPVIESGWPRVVQLVRATLGSSA
ncbi:MAG: P-loop NTPase fold protein [Polyangiaceae bacterium]